jgi:hypothetical protein
MAIRVNLIRKPKCCMRERISAQGINFGNREVYERDLFAVASLDAAKSNNFLLFSVILGST